MLTRNEYEALTSGVGERVELKKPEFKGATRGVIYI